MTVLNFAPITEANVSLLAGQPRGLAARQQLGLDELDMSEDVVTVIVPIYVTAITTSFVQGLFSGSLKRFNSKQDVIRHYDVSALSPGIKDDISAGLDRLFSKHELP